MLNSRNELQLQNAVATIGPISIGNLDLKISHINFEIIIFKLLIHRDPHLHSINQVYIMIVYAVRLYWITVKLY